MAEPTETQIAEALRESKIIEGAVRGFIDRHFKAKTEAAVIGAALLRILRELYDAYPPAVREQFVQGAVYFLERRDVEGELAQKATHIILPGGSGRIQ